MEEQHQEFVYDEEGRATEDALEGISGRITRRTTEYRDNGRRETMYEDTSDTISSYREWELDSEGKTLSITDYNKDGKISISEVFEYDENGRESKRERYNGSGDLIKYYVSIYDEEGRLVQFLHYSPKGELTDNWDYIYDEEGKRIGFREYKDGVLQREIKYE